MADVFPVTAPLYYDAAGNLREAVGVIVVPGTTYQDAAGNVRGAIGVNIVGGGGGGLPSDQAAVTNDTTITLLPASGTTPAQGVANVAVADNVATFRLAANRTALTTGATAPVQNSAGAAIATGTITIAANAITHIRLPATVAGVSNGGSVSVRNSAGADAHPATAAITSGVLTGVNLAATSAIVDNGDTFTTSRGETVNIAVAAGVATATVRSNPFWEPFTITVGDDGSGNMGYARDGNEGYPTAGSLTNQPVTGALVEYAITPGGNDLSIELSSSTLALNNITTSSQIGIGSTTYSPTDVTFRQIGSECSLSIYIAAGSFAWTVGQQVPIVIIP